MGAERSRPRLSKSLEGQCIRQCLNLASSCCLPAQGIAAPLPLAEFSTESIFIFYLYIFAMYDNCIYLEELVHSYHILIIFVSLSSVSLLSSAIPRSPQSFILLFKILEFSYKRNYAVLNLLCLIYFIWHYGTFSFMSLQSP